MPKAVRVYTASYCSFCRRAKDLLQARAISFEEIDVTTDHDRRRWLVETTGRRTVPQIFVGDEPIGGYDELRMLDASGKLAPLVAD